jgi:DNA-binding IclR family transcriptional regulator
VEAVLRESRRCGFGLHQGQIVPGVHALGVAVFDQTARPFGSLSVVGEAEKLPPSRVAQVAQLLNQEAGTVANAARRFSVSGKEEAQLDHYISTRADHDEHPFTH